MTSILIGGALRSGDVRRFVQAAKDDRLGFDDDGLLTRPTQLIAHCRSNRESLHLVNSIGWGVLHHIEEECRALGLTYVRRTDFGYAWWAPGLDRVMTCDHVCGEPVLPATELRAVMDSARPASGIRKLIENATPVNVPVFRIVGD